MNADEALESFADAVVARNPMHAGFLSSSLAAMTPGVRAALLGYLDYCRGRGLSVAYLAECYNTIVNDTRAEQVFFWKHKRYRYERYADVAQKVYFDPAYMSKYMYGLALTAFLWPNHAAMYGFFERTFPRGIGGTYLEIGPGHGYYLKRAAELGNFSSLVGVDLSPTSVAMTRDILAHAGLNPRIGVEIVEADFLAFAASGRTYSCVVMGEVLEHVEDPARFLHAIAGVSGPATHVFVTTCINAPAVDHIFLFRSRSEVERLVGSAGWAIVEALYEPYAGKTLEECERLDLSVNVAYVLRRA